MSGQCEGKVEASLAVTAESPAELQTPAFESSFKDTVAQWLNLDDTEKVIIDWDANNAAIASEGRRRMQKNIVVKFEVLVPTVEAADQADALAVQAQWAEEISIGDCDTPGSTTCFQADTSTMEATVTWAQFTNPISTVRLATDRVFEGGVESSYCDGNPHVLPIGTESQPGFVFEHTERAS
jgi:hypothetical protein